MSDNKEEIRRSMREILVHESAYPDRLIALIEALIDEKIADAMDAMSDRIEDASGVRP